MKNVLFITICLLFVRLSMAQESSAVAVIKKGLKEAKAEKKNLFVMFTGTWCMYCVDLKRKIDKSGILFKSNYVFKHINVYEQGENKHLEYKDALKVLSKYGSVNDFSAPFYVILNEKGKLIGSSYFQSIRKAKENIGYPQTEEELIAFVSLLKKTSKLNNEELKQIVYSFNPKVDWETLYSNLKQAN